MNTRDVVAVAVHLHPDAVELPLDGRRADAGERVGDVRRGRGEHRRERPADLQPEAREPVEPAASAAAATSASDPASVSAERTVARGTSAARATASARRPACAPWRSSPVSRPSSSRCSGAVAAREQARHQPARSAGDPLPDSPAIRRPPRGRRAPPATGQRRGPAGRGATPSRPRCAAGAARRRGRRRRAHLVGRRLAQAGRDQRTLADRLEVAATAEVAATSARSTGASCRYVHGVAYDAALPTASGC